MAQFSKNKFIEHKMCFDFLHNFETFLIITRYDQKYTLVFM